MAAPQTGYETHGGWTSLAEEEAFLATLATDTDAQVVEAGRSVQDRPIYRIDLGDRPDRTLMVTTLIHADEPASREAVLAWIRDLAYSTDPAVQAYLAEHRVVVLTPCNPDGQIVGTRNNGAGANINRDFYRLTQPETRTILEVAQEAAPHLAVDAHEFQGQPSDRQWLGRAGGNPMTHPAVQAMQDAAFTTARAAVQAAGYSTDLYWLHLLPRQGWSSVAGTINVTGLLSETNTAHPPSVRIPIQRAVLDAIVQWHTTNAHHLTEATTAAVQHATTTRDALTLYTRQFIGTDTTPETFNVDGYQLAPGQTLPQQHVDAFDITVAPGGYVPMQQPARLVIPALCDPASEDKVVDAERVTRPLSRVVQAGMRVYAEGRPRRVLRARHHDGTKVREVRFA